MDNSAFNCKADNWILQSVIKYYKSTDNIDLKNQPYLIERSYKCSLCGKEKIKKDYFNEVISNNFYDLISQQRTGNEQI